MFRAFTSPSSGVCSAAVYVLPLGSCSALLFVCVRRLCGLVRCGDYRVLQAARVLRSWVRIPPGAWIFVCCECRVLSGRGLCDELITHPEESYRLCCVVVCDLETSRMRAPYTYMTLVT